MATKHNTTSTQACECGCGQYPSKGRRFVYTHHLHAGERNTHWKGGVITKWGRVYVRNPDPFAQLTRKYVPRAHVVAEAKVGRPIRKGENVHHINGIKTDDRPENIVVLSVAEHLEVHRLKEPALYRSPNRSKLTPLDVIDMRRRRAAGETIASLARAFLVSHATATDAIVGRTWRHVA